VWGTVAQIVRKDTPWLYTVRYLLPPQREEQRHVQHLRYFGDAAYRMPASVRDSFQFNAQFKYQVDHFSDLRREGDVFQVRTHWAGFPDQGDVTWEPVSIIVQDVPTLLRQFVLQYAQKHPHAQLLAALFRRFPQLRREAV